MNVQRRSRLSRYKSDYYEFLDDYKAIMGQEYGGPQPTTAEAVHIVEIAEMACTTALQEFLKEVAERRQMEIPSYETPRSRYHLLAGS